LGWDLAGAPRPRYWERREEALEDESHPLAADGGTVVERVHGIGSGARGGVMRVHVRVEPSHDRCGRLLHEGDSNATAHGTTGDGSSLGRRQ
jgi:hypothetical protein